MRAEAALDPLRPCVIFIAVAPFAGAEPAVTMNLRKERAATRADHALTSGDRALTRGRQTLARAAGAAALLRLAAFALAAALLALLAACDTPQTTFEPRSDAAQRVHSIYIFVIVAASIVGFLVLAAMAYILVKYRERPGRVAQQIHGNNTLEITWTVIPILILIAIAVPTIIWVAGTTQAADEDVLEVTAVGHQWWFEFRYPGLGPDGGDLVTANELRIPVGRQIAIALEAKDVIHSFWVPRLVGKTDMVPNRVNQLEKFRATEVGEFYGQCAEFCGAAHALMRFRVHVDSHADFDRWVASMNAEPDAPAAGSAEEAGLRVFRAQCATCHAIQGVSEGVDGPNLTLFGDRSTVGAGILPSATENVKAWVSNVRDLKPIPEPREEPIEGVSRLMPTFYVNDPNRDLLTEAQVDQVTAYLKSLRLR